MMTVSREPAVGPGRRSSGAGFTIIEVIAAILILTIGILGLAGSTGYLVRTVTLGDLLTERTVASQSVIDRLQSLPYDSVTSGADTITAFVVSWNAVDDGPQSKVLTVVTLGPGVLSGPGMVQSPSVPDTFVFRILRN